MSSVAASQKSGVRADSRNGVLRELGLPAVFGAAVLFFSATMLLGVNISAMRSNLSWIQHTHDILREISTAEFGIVGDELTVRSYALTGDSRFLLYQRIERKKLMNSIAQLESLAAMEPGGAARMRTIRQYVVKHMELYAGITGLGPDKAAFVADVINNDSKRKIMFAARGALAEYRADEMRILGERQQNLTRQLSQSYFLAIGIIVAAFALGGLGLLAAQFRIPLDHR